MDAHVVVDLESLLIRATNQTHSCRLVSDVSLLSLRKLSVACSLRPASAVSRVTLCASGLNRLRAAKQRRAILDDERSKRARGHDYLLS